MTKIDENTGLAKLPEDMFWRVKEDVVYTEDFSIRAATGVRVKLMRKRTVKKKDTLEHVDEPAKQSAIARFFGLKPKTVRVVKVVEGKWEEEATTIGSLSSILSVHRKPKDGDWTRAWSDYSFGDPVWFKLDVLDPDEEYIRNLSVELWDSYISAQHGEALEMNSVHRISPLLGDYPPKKLGA